jgi:lipoate-protein ligase B
VIAGTGDETLLLCEHDPVITLGRSALAAHVRAGAEALARRAVPVVAASRGGSATYHGPGQLVGYPIVRLRGGVVGHLGAMARALTEVLASLGVRAEWRRDAPGLWVGEAKICAFGVHVRHRVAIHGFALNVTDASLAGFDLIVPCGIADARTTSIARELGPGAAVPALHVVAARVAAAFGDALGVLVLPDIDRAKAIEMSDGITRMIGA